MTATVLSWPPRPKSGVAANAGRSTSNGVATSEPTVGAGFARGLFQLAVSKGRTPPPC